MHTDKNRIRTLSGPQLAGFLAEFAETAYPELKAAADANGEPVAAAIERWLGTPAAADAVTLRLDVSFFTDGDFYFDGTDSMLDPGSPLYRKAKIAYRHGTDSEYYEFHLCARGDADACRYAARDLLERLMRNLRTFRPNYVSDDVSRLLAAARDRCLRKTEDEIDYSRNLGGNYEGTGIHIRITRGPACPECALGTRYA